MSKLCAALASAVAAARAPARRLPCVIGGDHSCAGGTWTGVARTLQGELGLIWIDAHMDSHTPGTSHTGRLHGMPLAWLLGQDDDALYGLSSGLLEPQHVCLIGVRSYEPEEKERLRAARRAGCLHGRSSRAAASTRCSTKRSTSPRPAPPASASASTSMP